MKIIRSVKAMTEWADASVRSRGSCGLVPTLGALHRGHASLIRKARRENNRVAVSVFVNPLQFRKAQYRAYPRDLNRDADLACTAGAHLLFAPSAEALYPGGFGTQLHLPEMFGAVKSQKIEWHFRGVLVVVAKLLNIVRPHRAYFGRKAPHQLAMIEKMVNDLNVPVDIRSCPTVRERDGLAYSSRNALLAPEERKTASVIYRSLRFGRKELRKKGCASAGGVIARVRRLIASEPRVRPEHVEIVDPMTLGPLRDGAKEAIIFASVWVGSQRLTDNLRFRL